MCGAPRVFEKVYNKAVTGVQAEGGAKAKIFSWAVKTGKQKVALEQAGKPVPAGLRLRYGLAEKLVFSKLQARLGGRMRVMVSGAAPLSKEIAEFFAAANLPISEGYGLTETSAGAFVNPPGGLRIGTVGRPMGDLECRIDTDGEVLLRGAPVMRGYHNLPEETAAAFTEDGFFRTGDIGELDADGYLRITDRKKDLVKTSGGKYIAPSHIEGMFKAICPYTSQAIVVGQARNYCTMLITLDPDAIDGWAAGGPLAGRHYTDIVTSPEVKEMVDGVRRAAQPEAQPLGDDQEGDDPAARPDHRGRRDDPLDEDQAPRGGGQLRRPRSSRCTRAAWPTSDGRAGGGTARVRACEVPPPSHAQAMTAGSGQRIRLPRSRS